MVSEVIIREAPEAAGRDCSKVSRPCHQYK
jgi:hypothetical protein